MIKNFFPKCRLKLVILVTVWRPIKIFLACLSLLIAFSCSAEPEKKNETEQVATATATAKDSTGNLPTFIIGKHYQKITDTSPLPEIDGQIQVIEFFSYGCPHCFRMEPIINAWLAQKPRDIKWIRSPAYWNSYFELMARAYYVAEDLEIINTMHEKLFNALHVSNKELKTKQELRAFFLSQNVTAEDYDNAFGSFLVKQKVKMADARFRQYKLRSVPSFVVGGEYFVNPQLAGGMNKVPAVIEHIVAKHYKQVANQ